MPRIKPKFKVGQWVYQTQESIDNGCYNGTPTRGPWEILEMNYYEAWERNPSPWMCMLNIPGDKIVGMFEEDLELDVFLSAVNEAINTKEKEPNDRKNQKARATRRRKSQPGQAQGDRRRSVRQVS